MIIPMIQQGDFKCKPEAITESAGREDQLERDPGFPIIMKTIFQRDYNYKRGKYGF